MATKKARSSGRINIGPRQMLTGKGGAVAVGGRMTDSGLDYNPPQANRSSKVAVNGTMSQGATSRKDLDFRSGAVGEDMGGQTSQDFTATSGARALFPNRRGPVRGG